MISTLIRYIVPIGGVGVLFAVTTRNAELPHAGGDMWFHLRLGEEFRGGWGIGSPGHLGVYDTAEWVPTQWLSQVGMSAIQDTTGLAGVLVAAAALHIALIAVIYLMGRSCAGPLAAALTTGVTVMGLAAGLTARPQVLSYLFVALTTWAWWRTAEDGRPRYSVIVLTWVWVPLHGMWPVGIVVSAVMAVAVALERRPGPVAAGRLALVAVGSLVLSVATPLGWRVYSGVAGVGGRSQYFSEWGPPDFRDPRTAGVLIMLAVVLVHFVRRGSTPWPSVALLGLGFACALVSFRMVPVAAVILSPLFAQAAQSILPPAGRVGRAEGAALVGMAGIVLAALSLSAPGRVEDEVVPAWVDAQLASAPAGSRVLNDWDSGAYFLWRHPEHQLVMHGYADVFTHAELERNVDITRVQPVWDDLVSTLDADLAVVDPETALAYALTEHAGWQLVDGDESFLLLRPPSRTPVDERP